MAQPYRSPGGPGTNRVRFGDPRRGVLSMVLGVVLIGVSVATVVAWTQQGGRIFGSVLLPALLGILLLLRARWGVLELPRERGHLLVQRRGAWPPRRDRIPLSDVMSVETVAVSLRDKDPDFDLNLVLGGERRLPLRRAATALALEQDRAAIADFLRAHGLLWGGGAAPRAVVAPSSDATDEAVEEATSDDRERAAR